MIIYHTCYLLLAFIQMHLVLVSRSDKVNVSALTELYDNQAH